MNELKSASLNSTTITDVVVSGRPHCLHRTQKQANTSDRSDNNVVILTGRYVLCADKSGYICGRRISFKAR